MLVALFVGINAEEAVVEDRKRIVRDLREYMAKSLTVYHIVLKKQIKKSNILSESEVYDTDIP